MRALFSLAAILAVSGVLMAGLPSADAHPGHTQKVIYGGRWYNAATMDLSTSQFNTPSRIQCDGDFASCSSKWAGPIQSAVNDWNNQQDTARFVVQPDVDINYDINIWVLDEVIQPGILGAAFYYGGSGNGCNPDACTYYYGDAVMADDGFFVYPSYDNYGSRQVTVSHELGHLLSLCHESVVGDCHSGEGAALECGSDDSGPVPASVMSYDCINPPGYPAWGSGIVSVQPFDVCGVNHAYPDGAYGFAGCPATPPPPPPPVNAGPNAWGNVDCDNAIASIDSLKILRHGAALSVVQTEPCTDIGVQHPVATAYDQGDVDCSGGVNAIDGLKLLRFLAGLFVAQNAGCPTIGVDPP